MKYLDSIPRKTQASLERKRFLKLSLSRAHEGFSNSESDQRESVYLAILSRTISDKVLVIIKDKTLGEGHSARHIRLIAADCMIFHDY